MNIGAFSPIVSCFLIIYSIKSCISDILYDPSGKSNVSFHVGADILNLLLL